MKASFSYSRNKYAYWTVFLYFFIALLVRVRLEYLNIKSESNLEIYNMDFKVLSIMFFAYIFLIFMKNVIYTNFSSAVIYSIVLIYVYLLANNRSEIIEFEAVLKSYIFINFPELCDKKVNTYVRVCPIFYYNEARYVWVINKNNEMSLPFKEWPEEIKQILGKMTLCEVNSKKKIAGYVYYFNGPCINY